MFMGAVDRIFANFEMLYDGYTDLPQTRKLRKDAVKSMEENGYDAIEMEQYISPLISEYERQGFLYGFRYAAALFLDGTLRYE